MTRLFGIMPGAYDGPYPTPLEAFTVIDRAQEPCGSIPDEIQYRTKQPVRRALMGDRVLLIGNEDAVAMYDLRTGKCFAMYTRPAELIDPLYLDRVKSRR